MGMYTELVLKAQVKSEKELPYEVQNILHHLFNQKELQKLPLPDHPFFAKNTRWRMIGGCSSYYHVPWSNSKYKEGYIFSRSDLKNYDDDIDQFLSWIKPYLDEEPGKCIGWSWYEEDHEPTLVYMDGEYEA